MDPNNISENKLNYTSAVPPVPPSKNNNKFLKWFGLAILILSFFLLLFIGLYRKKQVVFENTPPPTIQSTPTSTFPSYYIKILENKLSAENYSKPIKELFDCQPELFDPKTAVLKKHSKDSEYSSNGDEAFSIAINEIENNEFRINSYRFSGGGSSVSYVLDISKNNERLFLFTHIDSYSFSPDGKTIFIINWIKNNEGWVLKRRFINLETKKEINLPSSDCPGKGYWENNYFLSYEYPADGKYQEPDKVCILDKNGNISKQLSLVLDWEVLSGYSLNSQFGLLPKENNVFYSTMIQNNQCILALQDINNQEKNSSFILNNDAAHCETMEIDFNNLTISSDKVKFRQLEDYVNKTWSPWKEANSASGL